MRQAFGRRAGEAEGRTHDSGHLGDVRGVGLDVVRAGDREPPGIDGRGLGERDERIPGVVSLLVESGAEVRALGFPHPSLVVAKRHDAPFGQRRRSVFATSSA